MQRKWEEPESSGSAELQWEERVSDTSLRFELVETATLNNCCILHIDLVID